MMMNQKKHGPMESLMSEVKARKSPEKQLHESMVKKMNVGRVMQGAKGMMGAPGTMPNTVKAPVYNFMESQRKKAEEKDAARKARMAAPKKTDEATEYYKQMAREQRKKRGMD